MFQSTLEFPLRLHYMVQTLSPRKQGQKLYHMVPPSMTRIQEIEFVMGWMALPPI